MHIRANYVLDPMPSFGADFCEELLVLRLKIASLVFKPDTYGRQKYRMGVRVALVS